MHVLYEKTNFLDNYFPSLIVGFILLILVTFGWKYFLNYVESLEKSNLAKKGINYDSFRLVLSFFAFMCFAFIALNTPDILSALNQTYETTTGELSHVETRFEKDNSSETERFVTYFTIEDTEFNIKRNKGQMKDLIGLELNVSYLPRSHTVMKIELPLTDENLEKIDQLGINLHRYSQR